MCWKCPGKDPVEGEDASSEVVDEQQWNFVISMNESLLSRRCRKVSNQKVQDVDDECGGRSKESEASSKTPGKTQSKVRVTRDKRGKRISRTKIRDNEDDDIWGA